MLILIRNIQKCKKKLIYEQVTLKYVEIRVYIDLGRFTKFHISQKSNVCLLCKYYML